MPQFDFFSFFVQIFWLTVASCTFYLIYLKLPITSSSQVIKMRRKLKGFILKNEISKKSNFIYDSVISFL